MQAFYSATGTASRMPRLRLHNIRDGSFPELKGRFVKAANTRHLVPYALNLQQRATEIDGSLLNKHALQVVESLQHAYGLMYGNSYFLTDSQTQDLSKTLTRMGQHYQQLSVMAARAGEEKWSTRPKLHYAVAHLATQAQIINPRFTQTYGSEGLVGKICTIYEQSQSRPFHAGIQRKVLLKYRTGMAINFACYAF